MFLNHMVPLWAGGEEDFPLANSPLSSTATKTLAEGADCFSTQGHQQVPPDHREQNSFRHLAGTGKVKATPVWDRNPFLSTLVTEHS